MSRNRVKTGSQKVDRIQRSRDQKEKQLGKGKTDNRVMRKSGSGGKLGDRWEKR